MSVGWFLRFLEPHGQAFAAALVNYVTRPLSSAWWVGPTAVLFMWGVVPVMRHRHNVLARAEYGRAARFWWAPGWGFLGLVGLGFSLIAAPLLHPLLASRWAPSAWFGLTAPLSTLGMGALVLLGLALAFMGLKGYIRAWIGDRQLRYRAWRWQLVARESQHPQRGERGAGSRP